MNALSLPSVLAQIDPTTPPVELPEVSSGVDDWIKAVIVLSVALVLAFGARASIRRFGRRSDAVSSTVQIVARLAFSFLVLVGVYIALRTIGLDLGPAVAGAGIIGIALAFALQDIAENYVSGIILGFKNPFRPGDVIISGSQEGTVEELDLRYTTIRGYDGVRILVPNSMVLRNPLVNLTISGTRRMQFDVGVAYGTDLDLATRVAAKAAAGISGVESQPPADALVTKLDGSSINMIVRYWQSPRTTDLFLLRDRVIKAVVDALDDHDIEIPFEQRVLHVKQTADLQFQD